MVNCRRVPALIAALAMAAATGTSVPANAVPGGCSSATPAAVFDDFDGPAGSPPNPGLWDAGVGPQRDAGLQTYTASPRNVRLDGSGHLVIDALSTPRGFTSARLTTLGKRTMQYGRVAASVKFPAGQGIWPAFWLLGADYNQVGWPRSGEIDIIELVNTGAKYHITLHGPQGNTDYFGGAEATGQVVGVEGPITDLSRDFHEYWLDWRPNKLVIGIDDAALSTFTPQSLPPGAEWAFNKPMAVVLNVAVGGSWPGPPDASTQFPASMMVDWFRYSPPCRRL